MTDLDKATKIDLDAHAKELAEKADRLMREADRLGVEAGDGSAGDRSGQAEADLEAALREPLETLRRVARR